MFSWIRELRWRWPAKYSSAATAYSTVRATKARDPTHAANESRAVTIHPKFGTTGPNTSNTTSNASNTSLAPTPQAKNPGPATTWAGYSASSMTFYWRSGVEFRQNSYTLSSSRAHP